MPPLPPDTPTRRPADPPIHPPADPISFARQHMCLDFQIKGVQKNILLAFFRLVQKCWFLSISSAQLVFLFALTAGLSSLWVAYERALPVYTCVFFQLSLCLSGAPICHFPCSPSGGLTALFSVCLDIAHVISLIWVVLTSFLFYLGRFLF